MAQPPNNSNSTKTTGYLRIVKGTGNEISKVTGNGTDIIQARKHLLAKIPAASLHWLHYHAKDYEY